MWLTLERQSPPADTHSVPECSGNILNDSFADGGP